VGPTTLRSEINKHGIEHIGHARFELTHNDTPQKTSTTTILDAFSIHILHEYDLSLYCPSTIIN